MASDAHRRLSKFLLQQSDRHPIRVLSGQDVAGHDADVVRDFEQQRLVVQERDLRDADDVVFHSGEETALASSAVDLDAERVAPMALACYRIVFSEVARLLRLRCNLQGPPVEALSNKVYSLGARGAGRRRQEFFLARGLRSANALEVLLHVRAHSDPQWPILVLTPTDRALPSAMLRQVEGLQVVAVSDLLTRQNVPLAIKPLALTAKFGSGAFQGRLVVDSGGHVARLDDVELDLQPRDLVVLLMLANEARSDGGFVEREQIDEAIRESTGGDGNPEQVDRSISRIRFALKLVEAQLLIETKRGVGYRLTLPSAEIVVR